MKFIRSRDYRVRSHRTTGAVSGVHSDLPVQSEIRLDLENTLLGSKLAAMVHGDAESFDALAMVWSLKRRLVS